jgi:hypothetical protein
MTDIIGDSKIQQKTDTNAYKKYNKTQNIPENIIPNIIEGKNLVFISRSPENNKAIIEAIIKAKPNYLDDIFKKYESIYNTTLNLTQVKVGKKENFKENIKPFIKKILEDYNGDDEKNNKLLKIFTPSTGGDINNSTFIKSEISAIKYDENGNEIFKDENIFLSIVSTFKYIAYFILDVVRYTLFLSIPMEFPQEILDEINVLKQKYNVSNKYIPRDKCATINETDKEFSYCNLRYLDYNGKKIIRYSDVDLLLYTSHGLFTDDKVLDRFVISDETDKKKIKDIIEAVVLNIENIIKYLAFLLYLYSNIHEDIKFLIRYNSSINSSVVSNVAAELPIIGDNSDQQKGGKNKKSKKINNLVKKIKEIKSKSKATMKSKAKKNKV